MSFLLVSYSTMALPFPSLLKISQLVPQLLHHPVTGQINSLSAAAPGATLHPWLAESTIKMANHLAADMLPARETVQVQARAAFRARETAQYLGHQGRALHP